jgi:SpoVK/Ycf46/Vps4 family AAA+-type ATPase
MLANAIATKLKKKVLLVNFPNLGTNESGAIIKYLFREARINKALLFFDECESIFMSRFRYVLDFDLPDAATREEIWTRTVPKDCPLAKDVSLDELARRYAMCGGNIKNALLRAATTAALKPNVKEQVVTMIDLDKACSAKWRCAAIYKGNQVCTLKKP